MEYSLNAPSSASRRFHHTSLWLAAVLLLAVCTTSHPASESGPLPAAQLTPGRSVHCGVAPGQVDDYQLLLDGEELVRIVVDQRGVDLAVTLYDPQGTTLATADGWTAEVGEERLLWITESAGFYRLKLAAVSAKETPGCYELGMDAPRRPTREDTQYTAAARLTLEARRASSLDGLHEALSRWEQLGDGWWTAEVLNALGQHFIEEEAPGRAKVFFERNLEGSGDSIQTTYAAHQLSSIYRDDGEWDVSKNLLTNVLDGWGKIFGSERWRAYALNDLGLAAENLGDYPQALELYDQAIQVARDGGIPKALGGALHNRGSMQLFLGRWAEADADLKAALKAKEGRDVSERAITIIADSYATVKLGRPKEAVTDLGNLLPSIQEDIDRARALVALGHAQHKSQRLQEAAESYERALVIYESLKNVRGSSAVRYRLGYLWLDEEKAADALKQFQAAIEGFRRSGHINGQAESLLGAAKSLRALKRFAEARTSCEKALEIVEEMREKPSDPHLKSIFFASKKHFFDFHIDLLMEMQAMDPSAGYDRAAIEISERSRARSLFETIRLSVGRADGRSSRRAQGPESLIRGRTMTIQEIQDRLLDEETALLEYHLGETKSYLWLVTKDDFESFLLPPGEEIEQLARRTYESLPSPAWPAIPDRYLSLLSDLLLREVAPKLKARRLLIVGNAALQYVPFAALPFPNGLKSEDSERLISRFEIVHLPSASVLDALRANAGSKRTPKLREGLIVGAPALASPGHRHGGATRQSAGSDYPPLINAQDEILAIQSVYPSVDILSGRAAIKAKVMGGELQSHQFIHFVTHGTFDAEFPERSHLVLSRFDESDSEVKDWRLFLSDVYQLELAADLVVLSACQTALGEEIQGEGLVGMVHGFMQAGASSVVASLWSVDDDSTMRLMKLFYEHLAAGASPAGALRAAQLDFVEKFEDRRAPFYWAGFTVQGEF